MNRQKALEIGYRQLAIDFNTTPEAIGEGGIYFTVPARNPGCRAYSTELPFYSTSLSNLPSQNIAVSCGFRPAWVDVSAQKKEK